MEKEVNFLIIKSFFRVMKQLSLFFVAMWKIRTKLTPFHPFKLPPFRR
jgi:hypothetical protein